MRKVMESKDYILDIKEAEPSEEYYKDNWYAVFPNDYYKKIFGETVKETGNLPWKRKVVKIYSNQTRKSVHRIYKGAFRASTKAKDGIPIIRISADAARVLMKEDYNKARVSLQLTKGSKFMFYWNHFDSGVRSGFKLGFTAFMISLGSLVISILPFVIRAI